MTDASAPPSVMAAGSKQLPVAISAQQKQQELLKQVVEQQFVPKDPPAEFEFIADAPSISALDLYANTMPLNRSLFTTCSFSFNETLQAYLFKSIFIILKSILHHKLICICFQRYC